MSSGWSAVETKALLGVWREEVSKEQLDCVSQNRIEYEKVQWLTKGKSVPCCSAGTGWSKTVQCRNRMEYEKVQWLTKGMSVPGSSAATGWSMRWCSS